MGSAKEFSKRCAMIDDWIWYYCGLFPRKLQQKHHLKWAHVSSKSFFSTYLNKMLIIRNADTPCWITNQVRPCWAFEKITEITFAQCEHLTLTSINHFTGLIIITMHSFFWYSTPTHPPYLPFPTPLCPFPCLLCDLKSTLSTMALNIHNVLW